MVLCFRLIHYRGTQARNAIRGISSPQRRPLRSYVRTNVQTTSFSAKKIRLCEHRLIFFQKILHIWLFCSTFGTPLFLFSVGLWFYVGITCSMPDLRSPLVLLFESRSQLLSPSAIPSVLNHRGTIISKAEVNCFLHPDRLPFLSRRGTIIAKPKVNWLLHLRIYSRTVVRNNRAIAKNSKSFPQRAAADYPQRQDLQRRWRGSEVVEGRKSKWTCRTSRTCRAGRSGDRCRNQIPT